jgi:hypothetical protein
MFPYLKNLHFHAFANQHERHEYDKVIHASDAFAAKRNVIDGQTQSVADLEWHRRRIKSVTPVRKMFQR